MKRAIAPLGLVFLSFASSIASPTASVIKKDTVEAGGYFVAAAAVPYPNATYAWYKDGIAIPGETDSVLVIDSIILSDISSRYVCIARADTILDTACMIELTVIPPVKQNQVITITGDLLDANNRAVGSSRFELMNFTVRLYATIAGGTPLYTELFRGKQRIMVKNGHFTIPFGKGMAAGELQDSIASNKCLYAELSAGTGGMEELLGPRLMLSAAPYAFSGGVNLIRGEGNPVTLSVRAPVGAIYIDGSDGNKTWKKTSAGWVMLD